MACKQVIVLPPEIPMIYGLPARIQTFIPDMVPAIREVIAADPLSTKYGVGVEYTLTAFIQFMMAPSNAKHARSRWDPHSRWERYHRKIHPKGKIPYPTWFLNWLRKYLSDRVCRQRFWDRRRLKLRESLAPLVCNIMRLADGAASGDWRLSVV